MFAAERHHLQSTFETVPCEAHLCPSFHVYVNETKSDTYNKHTNYIHVALKRIVYMECILILIMKWQYTHTPHGMQVKHRRLEFSQLYSCNAHSPDITQLVVAPFPLNCCHFWCHPVEREGWGKGWHDEKLSELNWTFNRNRFGKKQKLENLDIF